MRAGLLALLAGAVFGLAAPAMAHAGLVSSTPKDGATLGRVPAQAVLTFTEEIGAPAYVVAKGPDGSITRGKPKVNGTRVTQALAGGPAGRYELSFRVVSADGHPISGTIRFRVKGSDASPSASPSPSPSPTASAPAASRSASAAAPAPAGKQQPGFWAEHGLHVLMGAALVAVAVGLLAWARSRR